MEYLFQKINSFCIIRRKTKKLFMKSKKLILFFSIFLSFSLNIIGQAPDSVKAYIDSSLEILNKNSLYAYKVNWEKIKNEVYDSAKYAKNKSETFSALKIAFDALGDKHAAYYQYDDQYKLDNPALFERYSDSIKAAWSLGPRIITKLIDDIAYINIPFIGVGKQVDIDKFANLIYNGIIDLSKKNPKGWIIDLRLNAGGNIRPMLAGVAMFFNNRIVSYYIDKDGKATDEASFYNGDFLIDGKIQASITRKISNSISQKIAVLIGPGTASSGEGVAIVFKQRKKTKLFGDYSAGLANATNGFVFNDNKSYFLISTARIGNKHKKILPEFVKPDVNIKGGESYNDLANDLVVKSAIHWLNKK